MKKACQYQVFRIVKEEIVLTREGAKDAPWDELVAELVGNPKDGAYAVFDYTMALPDGRPLNKLIFVSWVPGTCPVRPKMLYGSSMERYIYILKYIYFKFKCVVCIYLFMFSLYFICVFT